MPGQPFSGIAEFKNESRRVSFQDRRIALLQGVQQRGLYVIGLPDIDPLVGVGDAV